MKNQLEKCDEKKNDGKKKLKRKTPMEKKRL